MAEDRKKINLELFKTIYLIRKAEQVIVDNYSSDEMKTPMHMSMGSETISAGVCLALGKKGQAYGTYRSHALYLAKTQETDKFFAEMYGKVTGVVKGKGGSMHLISVENGLLGVSAIVGSTIPLAVGSAFANRYKQSFSAHLQLADKGVNSGGVVAVFFGDGATDEGVFWESLNLACLFKLPVLFVCEDNGLAVHTSGKFRHGYKSVDKIISQFNCQVFRSSSTDPEVIFNLTKKALKTIKDKNMPVFLHLKYYRYLEHVGVYEDFNAGYRDRKEFESWLKIDPIKLQRKKLLKLGIEEEKINQLQKNIDKKVIASLIKAQKDPFPSQKEVIENVFSPTK